VVFSAADPRFVTREEVTKDVLDREREIYREQTLASGKPANIVDKIVDGKMEFRSYYKMPAVQTTTENCVAHNGSIIPVSRSGDTAAPSCRCTSASTALVT